MARKIDEILAESNAQVVASVMGRDVTRGELAKRFKRVQDKEHWKNPIDATISIKDDFEMEMLREAIIFFTGSVPEFSAQGNNRYRVTAEGYFIAIGP